MNRMACSFLFCALLPVVALSEENKDRATYSNKEPSDGASEQSFLDFKPDKLLPVNTKMESSSIKVVLEPCKDENLLKAVSPGKGYNLEVAFALDEKGKMKVDSLVWSKDAVHEIRENISFAGYEFRPDKDSLIVFKVVPDKGYVFVNGKGTVVGPDKKEIALSEKDQGLILGRPVATEKHTEEEKPGKGK